MGNYGDPQVTARLKAKLKLPLFVAPMFLVSGRNLVVASSSNGILGSIPALNARTTEILDSWISDIVVKLETAGATAPFAVNLIAHASNTRLDADVDLMIKHKVPIAISSVGAPDRLIDSIHSYGGLVFSDAATVRHARRAALAGVDGLVLLSAGAGGNTGWLNPFAFLAEVRSFFDGPIALAGGISSGQQIAAAEMTGADFVLMGTTFIATRESEADQRYRDMLIESGADDVVTTDKLTGIPANMLRASLEKSGFIDGGNHKGFSVNRDTELMKMWRDIWSAGHGVGGVTKIASVRDEVERLMQERAAALKRSLSVAEAY
ncbi:nitronate monooxygenase [Bradyrhizobium sp. NAS96.2]|uniref:NAD(P)H-dependent flavin oxidoreductase n=1 Tax=Bradyrhizobium sp. NAS96.2 TaxID=1680160 RepID=UPI00093E75BF|nr:nitronate monooxygenase [Bradyrhizobium sp. NAS96.2]OKO78340.1 2-nitropropane dioxygenase [Bradyrhizobium sp. NAS96.2]